MTFGERCVLHVNQIVIGFFAMLKRKFSIFVGFVFAVFIGTTIFGSVVGQRRVHEADPVLRQESEAIKSGIASSQAATESSTQARDQTMTSETAGPMPRLVTFESSKGRLWLETPIREI